MATAMQSIKNGNKGNPPKLGRGVVKVVVIGEPEVGKTSFISAYYDHHEPDGIFSHNGVGWYECEFAINGRYRRTALFEIPSDPEFSKEQRMLHYKDAWAIVLLYAIDDPSSLEQLIDKWLPEVSEMIALNERPIVLVGNKKDLRDDPEVIERLACNEKTPVTYEKGKYFSEYEGIWDLREISTSNLEEVADTFDRIFKFILL